MSKKMALSDSSINKYGFRVLTQGLDLSLMEKNPIGYIEHATWNLPAIKWQGLSIEGDQLVGEPQFDEDDDQALKAKAKFEKGFLNGASIGFEVLETSIDPVYMLPGQTRPTVTKALVYEISLTSRPANRNAFKLSYKGKTIELNEDTKQEDVDSLLGFIPETTLNSNSNMSQINQALGLKTDASEAQAVEAIEALKKGNDKQLSALADSFVALGRKLGTITDENESQFRKLAANDFELALSFVEKGKEQEVDENPKPQEMELNVGELLVQTLKGIKPQEETADPVKTYMELSASGELRKLQSSDPEKFNKIVNDYAEAIA